MLYHFSEDGGIPIFEPRQLPYRTNEPAMVWTIDAFHALHYYFPRDCPRVCMWPKSDTTEEDRLKLFGQSSVNHVVAIESEWLERLRRSTLFRYAFDPGLFELYDANAGYYTAKQTV
ncbi:DUF6886 family protein [Paenibacillus silvisoli]|uniref:DUF6886 family protein n=1 Tax=Paenibacillus silvisoli TaxID=3110539 RepID=UPI002B1BE444|nr:DUF6886 family protein [Paenibacillus silvisoli]